MKKKYQIIVVLLLFALASDANSQTISIKGGLNLSNMSIDTDLDNDDDPDWKVGFVIGGAVEFPFTDALSLETGLFIASKGFKESGKYAEDWGGKPSNKSLRKLLVCYIWMFQ